MRVFLLVSSVLVACAVAHPDIGLTLNRLYQAPSGFSQNVHIPRPYMQLPHEHPFGRFATPPQMSYGAPAAPTTTVASLPPTTLPAEPTAPELPVAPEEPAVAAAAPVPHQQDSYNAAYEQSSAPHESGYDYAPQEPTIHKHIYVHVPPKDFDDEEAPAPRVVHQMVPKQKHYKIVFIKAPAAPKMRPPVIPPPPQNEEKTLIYVLHKKPEQPNDIVIPTAAPTKPTKPEVYFIKYKTRKEEAPVYGPPPASQAPVVEMDPRHAEPSNEYGVPDTDEFMAMDMADLAAPGTTLQPSVDEQQFGLKIDAPAEQFDAPEQLPSTAETPSNQYLAPASSSAPIVVEDVPTHVPATNYGPPSRYFLKKKK